MATNPIPVDETKSIPTGDVVKLVSVDRDMERVGMCRVGNGRSDPEACVVADQNHCEQSSVHLRSTTGTQTITEGCVGIANGIARRTATGKIAKKERS
jgi:hypothetical protein